MLRWSSISGVLMISEATSSSKMMLPAKKELWGMDAGCRPALMEMSQPGHLKDR